MTDTAFERPSPFSGAPWLVLPILLAMCLFVLRLRITSPTPTSQADAILLAVALGTFLLAIGAAIKTRGHRRRAWILLATGCLGWGYWLPIGEGPSRQLVLLLSASYVLLVVSTAAGVLMLRPLASNRETRAKLFLDLMPLAIAFSIAIWIFGAGSVVLDPLVPFDMRMFAIIHGFGSVSLLVLGAASVMSERRGRFDRSARLLVAAIGLLALADTFWNERLSNASNGQTAGSSIAFAAAFGMIGVAAMAAMRRGSGRIDHLGLPAAGPIGWESQLPDVTLAALLLLAGGQALFGETVPYGVATTIAGAVSMLFIIMARQSIVLRRDRHLRQEIGQLSEQIDGLMSQVGRDPLTGLLNHRAVHERIDHELASGRASGEPVAVVLIDVDNFKTVNDTLGHQSGDRVLRAVSSILHAACRATDVAARYAGDEFMLVLPGLNELHAGSVCARIAQEVRRVNEELQLGHGVLVSLSVGVAVTHGCQRSVAQTVAIADAAMYDAKEGGKNRIVVVNADTLVISDIPAPARTPDQLMADNRALFTWGEQDRRVG